MDQISGKDIFMTLGVESSPCQELLEKSMLYCIQIGDYVFVVNSRDPKVNNGTLLLRSSFNQLGYHWFYINVHDLHHKARLNNLDDIRGVSEKRPLIVGMDRGSFCLEDIKGGTHFSKCPKCGEVDKIKNFLDYSSCESCSHSGIDISLWKNNPEDDLDLNNVTYYEEDERMDRCPECGRWDIIHYSDYSECAHESCCYKQWAK